MPELRDKDRLAVGLMSGTSLDGVDAALVRLAGPADRPRVRLIDFLTVSYPTELHRSLLHIAAGGATTAGDISELNFRLGELFAQAALRVCRKGRTSPKRLSVIGSHGQTVFHQGRAASKSLASTLQIAEPAVIAERTGAPVVADFRTADLAAGGQGAPLVPMVDYVLLRSNREGRIALNLGGIANVTVIPPAARPEDVLGFDTGPGNMVTDALVRHFTNGRQQYDAYGRLAARGKVLDRVVAEALAYPFFRQKPPKSAGREQFGDAFVSSYFLGREGARPEDLVCTATEVTARAVADALERFVFSGAKRGAAFARLIVSGGGAHNRLLVSRLQALLPQLKVELSDPYGLPVDAKEAIAFAVLADRTLHGLPGNLPRVTDARRAVVLGKLVQSR